MIKYSPMDEMWGYLFIKALRGKKFRIFKANIMGEPMGVESQLLEASFFPSRVLYPGMFSLAVIRYIIEPKNMDLDAPTPN